MSAESSLPSPLTARLYSNVAIDLSTVLSERIALRFGDAINTGDNTTGYGLILSWFGSVTYDTQSLFYNDGWSYLAIDVAEDLTSPTVDLELITGTIQAVATMPRSYPIRPSFSWATSEVDFRDLEELVLRIFEFREWLQWHPLARFFDGRATSPGPTGPFIEALNRSADLSIDPFLLECRDAESQLRSAGSASTAIRHAASRGATRESAFHDTFQQLAPGSVRISSGEVFDRNHKTSRQCDALVTNLSSPARNISGYLRAPISGTIAFGEIKSFLDGEELADAVQKIDGAKKLQRQGSPPDEESAQRLREYFPRYHDGFPPRIFGFVVGFDGISVTSLLRALNRLVPDRIAGSLWGPDLVWVLGHPPIIKFDHFYMSSEKIEDLWWPYEQNCGMFHLVRLIERYQAIFGNWYLV